MLNDIRAMKALKELRNMFFSVHIIMHDYQGDIVEVICHYRQGHGENRPDIIGRSENIADAILSAYNQAIFEDKSDELG